jgi:hypothetical protein
VVRRVRTPGHPAWGWAIDGANRNDVALLEPTLDAVDQVGLLAEIGVLHLDRSYDSAAVRDRLRPRSPGVPCAPLQVGSPPRDPPLFLSGRPFASPS